MKLLCGFGKEYIIYPAHFNAMFLTMLQTASHMLLCIKFHLPQASFFLFCFLDRPGVDEYENSIYCQQKYGDLKYTNNHLGKNVW